MARSVIVSAVRTPFGKFGGALKDYEAPALGAIAIRGALDRVDVRDDEVEYVIMGQVLQGGAGQAPARQAAVGAGLPKEVPRRHDQQGVRLERARGRDRRPDDPRRRPRRDRRGRHGVDVERALHPQEGALRLPARRRRRHRLMVHDGLISAFDGKHMVEQASFVSRELGITREEQDAWALRSHQRAVARHRRGALPGRARPGGRRRRRTRARAATRRSRSWRSLKPVFDPEGTTTAGNAPGVNDGAGALVVTSEEFARKRGLEILATIVVAGLHRRRVRLPRPHPGEGGPRARSTRQGKTIDDVERVEINEAFSSVVVNSVKMLGADPEKVNVNGGAVALGHPIGASGARILGTMIYELRRNGGGLGLAAICSGGGQGDALLLEV